MVDGISMTQAQATGNGTNSGGNRSANKTWRDHVSLSWGIKHDLKKGDASLVERLLAHPDMKERLEQLAKTGSPNIRERAATALRLVTKREAEVQAEMRVYIQDVKAQGQQGGVARA